MSFSNRLLILIQEVVGANSTEPSDFVLFDQLAHGANRGVGRCVSRSDHEFELFAADLLAISVERRLEAADAVLTEHRIGPLEGRRDADLDFFLSDCGA